VEAAGGRTAAADAVAGTLAAQALVGLAEVPVAVWAKATAEDGMEVAAREDSKATASSAGVEEAAAASQGTTRAGLGVT
jgi:hypothetical protein